MLNQKECASTFFSLEEMIPMTRNLNRNPLLIAYRGAAIAAGAHELKQKGGNARG